jgi:hypothetical protein
MDMAMQFTGFLEDGEEKDVAVILGAGWLCETNRSSSRMSIVNVDERLFEQICSMTPSLTIVSGE